MASRSGRARGVRELRDVGCGREAWDRVEKSWSVRSVWWAMLARRRLRREIESMGGVGVGFETGRRTVMLCLG